MSRYERSIKLALDKSTGEILKANEVFEKAKDAFSVRRKYHEGELQLSCCECEQDLMISASKFDRLHFKHKPGHSFCILSDGNLSVKEQSVFEAIHIAKESPRHIELKTKIGERLKSVDGVIEESIAIDDKFIIRDGEKRRPDVYCKYKNHELVFEIQLSNLSLGYILSRYEFYRKHGMFLIWILDNFDIHDQGTLERDIKYLTRYENFFKLDDDSDSFKLLCEYKYPFLTDSNKLLTKWQKKSVSLSEIKFDSESYQAYYYDFGTHRSRTEKVQEKRFKQIKEEERLKREQEKIAFSEGRAKELITEIKRLKQKGAVSYVGVSNELVNLSEFDLKTLNRLLKLKERKHPLITWVDNSKKEDWWFIEFLICSQEIEKNLNEKKNDGISLLMSIIQQQIWAEQEKRHLLKRLVSNGYVIDSRDECELRILLPEDEVFLFIQIQKLKDKSLSSLVFLNSKVLFIIESAKRKDLIGYNYRNKKWIQLANNALHYHDTYWEYIELAFKRFHTWELIEKEDTKGSFEKKLRGYHENLPNQDFDIDQLIHELYPELFL